jgi:hypothetical protein
MKVCRKYTDDYFTTYFACISKEDEPINIWTCISHGLKGLKDILHYITANKDTSTQDEFVLKTKSEELN